MHVRCGQDRSGRRVDPAVMPRSVLATAFVLTLACADGGGEGRTVGAGGGLSNATAPETGDEVDAGGTNVDPGTACDPDSVEPGDTVEFSYIWIANSPEGTVSKIDTRTRV